MIPAFVLNLAWETERRASITSQLNALGVPFTLIDAVDRKRMGDDEVDRIAPRRRRLTLRWPLSKGEIGCALSHRAAIERVFEGGHEFGCVIEDDAKPAAALPTFLDADWLRQLPPFDILKLAGDWAGKSEDLALPIGTHVGYHICAPVHPSYSACCYILSREGAARTLQRLRIIDDSSDVMMFRRPMTNGRFLDVRPLPVTTLDFTSSLHADRWHSAPAPWWRPPLAWLPHRIALWERKVRRLTAFARTNGLGAFGRVQTISPRPQPGSPPAAHQPGEPTVS